MKQKKTLKLLNQASDSKFMISMENCQWSIKCKL